ncbi:MAG: hypothetical protein ABIC04_04115 [Nanoarchaeota archaeon]
MDEEEIDMWYEDEKEKAMSVYLEDLDKKKNKEESETKFKQRLKFLRDRYMILYEQGVKKKKKQDAFYKKIENIKNIIIKKMSWVKK